MQKLFVSCMRKRRRGWIDLFAAVVYWLLCVLGFEKTPYSQWDASAWRPVVSFDSVWPGVFEVHGRITGRFVLQEAMERCLYREEKTLRGDGMTVGEISSRAGQRLRGFFRCGDAVLTIREDGGDLDGRVKSSTETEISLRGQEPERALRLLTVLENAE